MNVLATFVIVILAVSLTGCERKPKEEALMPVIENLSDSSQATTTSTDAVVIDEGTEGQMATATDSMGAAMPTSAEMAGQTGSFHNVSTKAVQEALKNASLYSGNVDGVLGPKTKKAIKEFQTQNKLSVDGRVGPKTWQKLEPYLHQASASSMSAAEGSN